MHIGIMVNRRNTRPSTSYPCPNFLSSFRERHGRRGGGLDKLFPRLHIQNCPLGSPSLPYPICIGIYACYQKNVHPPIRNHRPLARAETGSGFPPPPFSHRRRGSLLREGRKRGWELSRFLSPSHYLSPSFPPFIACPKYRARGRDGIRPIASSQIQHEEKPS